MTDDRAAGSLAPLHHIGILTTAERHDDVGGRLLTLFAGTVELEEEDEPLDARATWIRVTSSLILEVVSPRGIRDTPLTKFLARTGGGLHHVSFETSEIGACRALVVERGSRIRGESADHSGWREFFVDPEQTGGALLHWMQRL